MMQPHCRAGCWAMSFTPRPGDRTASWPHLGCDTGFVPCILCDSLHVVPSLWVLVSSLLMELLWSSYKEREVQGAWYVGDAQRILFSCLSLFSRLSLSPPPSSLPSHPSVFFSIPCSEQGTAGRDPVHSHWTYPFSTKGARLPNTILRAKVVACSGWLEPRPLVPNVNLWENH